MKVQVFVENNGNVKNILPARLRRLEISALQFSSLRKGFILILYFFHKIDCNIWLRYCFKFSACTVLSCRADTVTRRLLHSDIRMCDFKYETSNKVDVRFDEFRFIPYRNPQCQVRRWHGAQAHGTTKTFLVWMRLVHLTLKYFLHTESTYKVQQGMGWCAP